MFCQDKKEAEERKRIEQQAKTDELLKDTPAGSGHVTASLQGIFGGHPNRRTFLSCCENAKKPRFAKSSLCEIIR